MTLTLDQYNTLEAAALMMAAEDPDWPVGTDRYFMFDGGTVVTADPNQFEIEGGTAFIGFKKYTKGDTFTVRPLVRRSRPVQIMRDDQQAADAIFIEGDYISKDSIRILGYTMYAGTFIEHGDSKWEVICFTEIANLHNDTELNDLPNVVLYNRNTGATIAHSVGPWLRTIGIHETITQSDKDPS